MPLKVYFRVRSRGRGRESQADSRWVRNMMWALIGFKSGPELKPRVRHLNPCTPRHLFDTSKEVIGTPGWLRACHFWSPGCEVQPHLGCKSLRKLWSTDCFSFIFELKFLCLFIDLKSWVVHLSTKYHGSNLNKTRARSSLWTESISSEIVCILYRPLVYKVLIKLLIFVTLV